MISPKLPLNEADRLKDLIEIELLDSPSEAEFNDIVKLASEICKVPISLITLVDADRQWFKAKIGLDIDETNRDISFCGHAILQDHFFEIRDAQEDERFNDNPMVTNNPRIRYYAGMPLITSMGNRLGTLCVIDNVPRELTPEQRFALEVLSRNVIKIAELRLKNKQLSYLAEKHKKLTSILAHDVRNPLASVKSIIEFRKSGLIDERESEQMMDIAMQQLDETMQMIDDVVDWGKSQLAFYSITEESVVLSEVVDNIFKCESLNTRLKHNKLINNVGDTTLLTDKQAISLILRNLVGNAGKYTENGSITISAKPQANGLTQIMVSDTGVGMDNEYAANLFNDGHQLSTNGTRNEKGSGLGLVLVKEFVNKLKGIIKAESEHHIGTVVTIEL
jgi:signal transduction histidine kinase